MIICDHKRRSRKNPSDDLAPYRPRRRHVDRFLEPLVWKQVGALVLVVTALVVVAVSDVLHGTLTSVLDAVEPVITERALWGAVAFTILAALSAMLAFFSSVILVPVALQVWGYQETMVLLWLGWTLGGVTSYLIGKSLGRSIVTRLAPKDAFDRFERLVTRRTPFGHILLFQLTLPSEIPGYVLGTLRYSFWKYLLALCLAEIPFVLATTAIGAGLLQQELLILLSASAALALVVAVALLVIRRRLHRDRSIARQWRSDRQPGRQVVPRDTAIHARQAGTPEMRHR